MAKEQPFIIDHSDATQHARFMTRAAGLRGTGKRAWTSKPYRPKRSLKANAFWWACCIPAFQGYMRQHGQYFEPDEIHEFFLKTIVPKPFIDPVSGEVTYVGSRSSKMDSAEFSQFVNDAIGWMQDRHQVSVPLPEDFAPPARALPAPRKAVKSKVLA